MITGAKFQRTPTGGILLIGGDGKSEARVELDAAGNVISHTATIAPVEPPKLSRPGDLLAVLIHRVTGETPSPNCECAERQQQMNQWGWAGCWVHRHEIIGWVILEARMRGHDTAGVAGLVRAALKEAIGRSIGKR